MRYLLDHALVLFRMLKISRRLQTFVNRKSDRGKLFCNLLFCLEM